MKRCITLALSTMALFAVTPLAALAQTAPPTYEGDPAVYKVIFEDQNFRVIAATWPKGLLDKPHSHPVPSIAYALTDCSIRLHAPDGTTREVTNTAGKALAVPITASHTAENISPGECRILIVEHK